jgi:hypothetical protein
MRRETYDDRSDGPQIETLEPRTLLSALSIANLVLPEGNSGQKSFNFTVSLSEAAAQDVTVHYRTASGTATSGQDYNSVLDGTVTILAGQTSAVAAVPVIGDTAYEPFETFTVELFNPSGAAIAQAQATGVILNDDAVAGSLIAWGDNSKGQLGVPDGSDFIAVDAGSNHGVALRSDGTLVCWGDNSYDQAVPPAGNDFVAIAAGYNHNLAIRSDGSIEGWGINELYGQATGPAGNDFVAVAAGSSCSLALRSDGSLHGWGNTSYGQTNTPAGHDFVAIAAGLYQALALRSDGSLATWGTGASEAPSGNDFVAIAAGYGFDVALRADGSLVEWGSSEYGLASVPAGNNFVAISARGNVAVALRADGTVAAWGDNTFGQATPPTTNDFVAALTGGRSGFGVQPINAPPVITAPADQTFNEDTVLVFSAGAGNAISVADLDCSDRPLLVTLTATHGVLTLGGSAVLQSVAGNGTAMVTFKGVLDNVNAAFTGLAFHPAANYNGPASLQIVVDDQGATGSGGAKSDSKTVTLTVNPVNDTPVAYPQSVHTDGDTAIEITLLGNDHAETPADQLIYTPTAPAHGTLTPMAGKFVYLPEPGYVGPDSFTFTVTDNGDPAGSHANPGDLTGAPATVSISVGYRQAFTSGHAFNFVDDNGIAVKVLLSGPGSAEAWFPHDEDQANLGRIILTRTTTTSTLSITPVKYGTKTTVGPIDVQGSLGSLTATAVTLQGDLGIGGTLGRLSLDSLTGGTIHIGGLPTARTGPTLTFGQVVDGSVVSTMPITSITAKQWLDVDGTPDTITAPRLGTLSITGDALHKVAGDFAAGLALSGLGETTYTKTLTTATIKGSAAPTLWDVSGKVGAVTVGGAVGAAGQPWQLVNATALASLNLGQVADAQVTVGGAIGTIRAKFWLDGAIQATKITSITTTGIAKTLATPVAVSGDFRANVTLNNAASKTPLLAMTLAGWLDGAMIDSNGPLGAFTMVGMHDSTIQAGASKIAGVTVRGILRDPQCFFINSNISAYTLGTISIRAVQGDSSSQPFGITGHTVAVYSRDGHRTLNLAGARQFDPVGNYLVNLT